jgi:hypothetical protein
VLDLPFGQGRKYLANVGRTLNALVGGWGIDGVTTWQRGFPLVFGNGQANDAALFGAQSRPNVVPGCDKAKGGARIARLNGWFDTSCFTAPADFTFGNESRVDATLRSDGVSNFDFAVFKKVLLRPEGRMGFETRVEFFNLFNRPQFAAPNTVCCTANNAAFGFVTSTAQGTNPRLIQFAMKFFF